MIIKLFDKDFNLKDIIVQGSKDNINFAGFEWVQNFLNPDTFAINIPVTNSKIANSILNEQSAFVVRADNRLAGFIEGRKFKLSDGSVEISGIGTSGLLKKRATTVAEFHGTAGKVMCDLINANNPFNWLIADGDKNNFGEEVAVFTENTGNVLSYLEDIAKKFNIGFTTVYNENLKKVEFKVLQIKDPQKPQLISDEWGNAKDIEYSTSNSKYYNFMRVIGDDDITVIIDNSEGQERYEINVKSKIKKRDLTTEQYQTALKSWGNLELAKRNKELYFEVPPTDDITIEIGETVACNSRFLDFTLLKVCTSIKETWETSYSRDFTFGYKENAKTGIILAVSDELQN